MSRLLPRTAGTRRAMALARAVRRRADPALAAERRAVRRGLRLPDLPRARRRPGSVWAVGMVRDEIDVLEGTLRHLTRQGVDRILVVDNGSVDGTRDLLDRLAGELPLLVGEDREPRYLQAPKMNALAAAARRAGADWVVPFDADELWFARAEPLADRLRAETADVVTAHLYNLFPTPTGVRLDTAPHFAPKVAFRAHALAWLEMGNHEISHPGRRGGELLVVHHPWRSRAQLERKGRQGAAALTARQKARGDGRHWTRFEGADAAWVEAAWADLVAGRPREDLWWSPRGPFLDLDPRTWATWPADLLPAGGSGA